MLRYFVVATVLVVGAGLIVVALHPFRFTIAVGAGRGTMAPKPAASLQPERRTPRGLRGDAPWALSALPECLIQVQEWHGTLESVRARLAPDAREIAPPATLRYADCTIFVSKRQATVVRGDTRLRIPPFSRFFRLADNGIALVRSTGCERRDCSAVLRIYAVP